MNNKTGRTVVYEPQVRWFDSWFPPNPELVVCMVCGLRGLWSAWSVVCVDEGD